MLRKIYLVSKGRNGNKRFRERSHLILADRHMISEVQEEALELGSDLLDRHGSIPELLVKNSNYLLPSNLPGGSWISSRHILVQQAKNFEALLLLAATILLGIY